jgi:hypothetical protein
LLMASGTLFVLLEVKFQVKIVEIKLELFLP